jgi:hypothetical protein
MRRLETLRRRPDVSTSYVSRQQSKTGISLRAHLRNSPNVHNGVLLRPEATHAVVVQQVEGYRTRGADMVMVSCGMPKLDTIPGIPCCIPGCMAIVLGYQGMSLEREKGGKMAINHPMAQSPDPIMGG